MHLNALAEDNWQVLGSPRSKQGITGLSSTALSQTNPFPEQKPQRDGERHYRPHAGQHVHRCPKLGQGAALKRSEHFTLEVFVGKVRL